MRLILGCLVALSLAVPAQARQGDLASLPSRAIEVAYEGWVGGVYMMDARFRITLGPEGYQVRGKALNAGFSSMFANWKAELEAIGDFRDGAILPRLYESRREWGRDKRMNLVMRWRDDRVPEAVRDPKPLSEDDRLDDALTAGSMDAVNAMLTSLITVARQDRCEARVPVFDGRKRYDVLLRDGGRDRLQNQDVAGWDGFARKCLIDFALVAGFEDEDNPYWDSYREGSTERPEVPIWLARFDGADGLEVPVRLQTRSSVGVIVFYLRDIQVD